MSIYVIALCAVMSSIAPADNHYYCELYQESGTFQSLSACNSFVDIIHRQSPKTEAYCMTFSDVPVEKLLSNDEAPGFIIWKADKTNPPFAYPSD
jgi:hypothetical protein